MPLDSTDLADIRAEAGEWLETDVTIQRYVVGTDNAGGTTKAWSEVTTVKGRLERPGGAEAVAGGRESLVGAFLLKLPAGTDIVEADRVLIAGTIYQVSLVDRTSVAYTQASLDLIR